MAAGRLQHARPSNSPPGVARFCPAMTHLDRPAAPGRGRPPDRAVRPRVELPPPGGRVGRHRDRHHGGAVGLALLHRRLRLHNEIAHRAIHLSVVLGLCFLVFPRQKRLPGPWEWIVSIGLVAFYLVMGWTLVQQVGADAPPGAQAVFFVPCCWPLPGCRCRSRPTTAATSTFPGATGSSPDWRRASRCTCWSSSTASSSSARASTRRWT
jgi:hypothetical protein